jgi:hypothetical protein
MFDVLMVALTILFFVVAVAYVVACERLAPAAMPTRNAPPSVVGKASASGGGAPRESK